MHTLLAVSEAGLYGFPCNYFVSVSAVSRFPSVVLVTQIVCGTDAISSRVVLLSYCAGIDRVFSLYRVKLNRFGILLMLIIRTWLLGYTRVGYKKGKLCILVVMSGWRFR